MYLTSRLIVDRARPGRRTIARNDCLTPSPRDISTLSHGGLLVMRELDDAL